MPKLKPSTKEAKAKRLRNLYLEEGTQAGVARREGVSEVAIAKRFKTLGVQKTIIEEFERVARRNGFTKQKAIIYAIKKCGISGEEGMAKKVISAIITGKDAGAADHDFVEVPDEAIQHKWFVTVCQLLKWLDAENPLVSINQYTQIWTKIEKKASDVETNGRVHLRNQKEVPA